MEDLTEQEYKNFMAFIESEFAFYGLPYAEYEIEDWSENLITLVRPNGAMVEISGLEPMDNGVPIQYFFNVSVDSTQQQRKAQTTNKTLKET